MTTRLESEVWALDNCAGCGLCVAACSKQVLKWNGSDHPILEQRSKTVGYTKETLDSCSFCQKFCEEACPRLQHWAALEPHNVLAASARAPMRSGGPNDVIRAVLAAGRSAGLLDGILMLDVDPWDLKPVARIASTVLEVVSTVGPQYLWAPVFDVLNEAVFVQDMRNIAVASTPCAAQAMRKLKSSSNTRLKPYQDAVRLTIAVFCTGTYRPELVNEILVKRMDVAPENVKRLQFSADRESMQAVLWDGSLRTIPRQQAESYTRAGCGTCDDYLGESADIAVGTLGAPEGAATLIARSRVGDMFVRNAIQMNLLETSHRVDLDALAAASADKDRRERAQSFKDLQILMLDALADPLRRGEALQQFARLYRTPERPGVKREVRGGCTSC
jgi:coenzyme F420-reducing hydrogenase beta subunit